MVRGWGGILFHIHNLILMPRGDATYNEENILEEAQELDPAHITEVLLVFIRAHAKEAGTEREAAVRLVKKHIIEPTLRAFETEENALDALLKAPGGSLEENKETSGARHLIQELRRLLTCVPSKENVLKGIAPNVGE